MALTFPFKKQFTDSTSSKDKDNPDREFLKAIKYHKKLAKIDQLNSAVHLSNIGANYRYLEELDKALEYYNKSLKLNKSYLLGYLNLSEIYKNTDCFLFSRDLNKSLDENKKIILDHLHQNL